MTCSIPETIVQNADVDIIKTFNGLRSQSIKVHTIEQVIDLCGQKHSHLVHHRCLLTLARLLEELTIATSPNNCAVFLNLFRRCSDLNLISGEFHDPSQTSLLNLVAHLSSSLKMEAAYHLRKAIAALCPYPEDALAATKHALKNASILTLAPVRLDLGMGGISDIPPYSLERYGNCLNVPIRLDSNFPLEVRIEVLTEPVIQFVSKDLGVTKTYRDALEFDDQIATFLFHREVIRFFMDRILDLKNTEEFYLFLKGGLCLETYSRLPVGTGLGVSSLLLCAS